MDKTFVIKSLPYRELAAGFTKVKVMPENYQKIISITGMTGKTIQSVVDELLAYALDNVRVDVNGVLVKLPSNKEDE